MRYGLIFRYLFAQHLWMALLVLVCLFLIVLLGQFADMARYQSEAEGWSAFSSLKLALFRSPSLMQAVLPHVLLVSAALTVARACRRSEVTIMMQNGLSYLQILAPVTLAAVVLGAVYTGAINPLASFTYSISERALSEAEGDGIPRPDHQQPRELVLRDAEGADYLLIDHVAAEEQVLYGVTLYRVDGDHALLYGQEAERAVLTEAGWLLEGVREIFRAPRVPSETALPLTFEVEQTALEDRFGDEDRVSFYNLPRKIALAQIVGAPDHELRMQFLWLVFLPLLLGALSLLSGALVIRPMQRGAWKGDASMVLGSAFVVYTASTVLDALGTRAVVAPWVTVTAMPALCVAVALASIWAKKRGGWRLSPRRARRGGDRAARLAPLGSG